MSLEATTELEAINEMTRLIGESPASSLASLPDDAIAAQAVLKTETRRVLAKGWHFNTDEDFPLTASAVSPYAIAVPTGAISVDPEDIYNDYVIRAGKLYDRKNHTFNLEGKTVKCQIVWLFPFDELPETLRQYIVIRAGRNFASDALQSGDTQGYTEADELAALVSWEAANHRVGDVNMIRDSYSVNQINRRNAGGDF